LFTSVTLLALGRLGKVGFIKIKEEIKKKKTQQQ
jgi:hypothetical protein